MDEQNPVNPETGVDETQAPAEEAVVAPEAPEPQAPVTEAPVEQAHVEPTAAPVAEASPEQPAA